MLSVLHHDIYWSSIFNPRDRGEFVVFCRIRNVFKKFWFVGRIVSKQGHLLYFILVLGSAFILLAISGGLYNLPFSLRTVAISNLGNPTLNPRGWWVFTISFVFTGLALLPHIKYLYSRFQSKPIEIPILKYIWLIFMLFSCIGMVGVGILNETLGAIHYVVAIFGFGGMGLNMLYTIALLVYSTIRHRNWFPVKRWMIFYGGIFMAMGVLIREFSIYGIANPADLNFSEWWALFLLVGWFIGIYFLLEKDARSDD
jgi:hypothetical protein